MRKPFSIHDWIHGIVQQKFKWLFSFVLIFLLILGVYKWQSPRYIALVTLEIVRPFSSEKNQVSFHQANLQQRDILYPVIAQLNLTQRWQKNHVPLTLEQAYQKLLKQIRFKPLNSASFLEVHIEAESLSEGVHLTRAIAQSYVFWCQRRMNPNAPQNLDILREAIQKQTSLVQTLSNQCIALSETFHVTTNSQSRQVVENFEKKRYLLQEKVKEWQSIKDLSSFELADYFSTKRVEVNAINNLLSEYRSVENQMEQLLVENYGKDHPRFQEAAELLVSIQKRLGNLVLSLRQDRERERDGLEKEVKSLAKEVEIIEKNQKSKILAHESLDKLKSELALAETELADYQKDYKLSQKSQTSQAVAPVAIRGNIESQAYELQWLPVTSIGGIAAFILATLLIVVINGCDRSVKNIPQFERALGLSVLAVIPRKTPALNRNPQSTVHAESYRLLKVKLEGKLSSFASCRIITAVSGGAGEGKSTTLFNLAWVIAESGAKVLLIDADLRRPTQHRFLDKPNAIGLGQLLTGTRSYDAVVSETPLAGLHLIASGLVTDEALQRFNAEKLKEILNHFKMRYDWILWDAPPVIGVSDGLVLLRLVHGAIMVVQPKRYPLTIAQRVKTIVEEGQGNILGAVFNQIDSKENELYEFYTSYYGYYGTERD